MLELRLKALGVFQSKSLPSWGPNLSGLNLDSIRCFAKADVEGDRKSWEDVPDDIKRTFDRLGIPEAEKAMLAGVGAQYDSEVVYHSLRQELQDLGVIFEDMSVAIHAHEELVRSHFMKAIPIGDHTFAALHAAVWSGGTFLYIPKGVVIEDPLQAYFRMNAKSGGQFEHTIIIVEDGAQAHYIEGCSAPKYGTASLHAGCVEIYVGKKARMRYSSVENWSIDTYNLNTKRAIVEDDGFIEWVGGNMGSGVTMLYPCSVLKGHRSSASHIGVALAAAGQDTDTGAKVIHIGEHTTSTVLSKSLSKDGGRATYRGLLDIKASAI
jgi:Fe-S cluster assembly protein SufB